MIETTNITPERMKAIRHEYGLTVNQMAALLRLTGERGGEKVRALERGAKEPSGPITLIYELLDWDLTEGGGLPDWIFPYEDGDEGNG